MSNTPRLVAVLSVITAISIIVHALYLPAKAIVAQWLLQVAWQDSLISQEPQRPWPWADTTTVGVIRFPQFETRYVVLAGSSGHALAFGPGHLTASRLPHQSGHLVISGHRDSHFAVLQHLQLDDIIVIETIEGRIKTYQITERRLVDSRIETLRLETEQNKLTLITCYPFEALQAGGPWRLRIDAILT